MKLEQIVKFSPAFDKRSNIPGQDYGIGTVRCFMVLKGKDKAVHFVFSTGMLLESTVQDYIKDGRAKYEMLSENNPYWLNKPMGYDVGYHTTKKQFKGQEISHPTKVIFPKEKMPAGEDSKNFVKYTKKIKFKKIGAKPPNCEWLGKPCYCDGSAMEAERYMDILLKEGSDKIWEMLEEYYKTLQ